MNDAYLGDGLYAAHDGHIVELYASNGVERTNRVFLDPDTLAAFIRYIWMRISPDNAIAFTSQLIADLALRRDDDGQGQP
jgi:hypothetical protein